MLETEPKDMQVGKQNGKLLLFLDNVILYNRKLEHSDDELKFIRVNIMIQRVARHKHQQTETKMISVH